MFYVISVYQDGEFEHQESLSWPQGTPMVSVIVRPPVRVIVRRGSHESNRERQPLLLGQFANYPTISDYFKWLNTFIKSGGALFFYRSCKFRRRLSTK